MKKIETAILVLIALVVAAFANPQEISKLIKERTGQNIKVVKVVPLPEMKGFNLAILEGGGQQVAFFASEDGKTLIGTDSSFLTSHDSLLLKLQKSITETQIANNRGMSDKLLAEIKGNKYPVITLKGNVKTNKTTYIVSDPNCPYCKDELGKLEQRLQTSNVKYIVVGILHESSLSKATDIYNQMKMANDNKTKINILRKVYANNYDSQTQPSQEALGITQAVRNSGITAVPYKFDVTE